MKISDLFGPVGSREVKSFLGCSSYFDKVKEERIEMELYFSFDVWTCGFEKRESRELLALSLREKRAK